MNLLTLLHKIPLCRIEGYGDLINFGDILDVCKRYGQDNQHIIKAQLKLLEKEGLIRIIHHKDSGFEDLIIGVNLI